MSYNAKAQKKYREKSLSFTVCYRPSEIAQGKRLKKYLEESGQSTNAYLKKLIADDLNRLGVPCIDDNTDIDTDIDI